MLVAFWPPDIHHPCGEAGAQGRRVVTGCSDSRRSPVHSDNPGLHRRRHRRSTPVSGVDLTCHVGPPFFAVPKACGMRDLLFAGSATLLARSHGSTICGMTQSTSGLVAAVEAHDTAAIFDWLMRMLSFQGISDAVAEGYMDRHGNVTWAEIEACARHQPRVRQAPGVLGVYRLPVPQGCADLRRAGPIRRLPPAPASPPERAAEPNRVQLVPVHPGHCRWRHRRVD